MAVVVSFMKSGEARITANVLGIGDCRAKEVITVPGTTSGAAQAGEMALVASSEAALVLGAHGTTPDAQAATGTAATSAGYPIPAGVMVPVRLSVGDKLNFKVVG